PDHSPGIGGGGHAEQTGRMLLALEPILVAEHPDAVLVYGDTNSTVAGALAAAKLGIPVAHVEAGLRSFDRRMPEELNRVVADHLATWCFAPTPAAVANLAAEGIARGVLQVGDLMQDLAARVVAEVRDPAVLRPIGERLGLALRPGGFIFATVHRVENRDPAAMAAWTDILGAASQPDRPVVLALHPGTAAALDDAGMRLPAGVRAVAPQGYRTTLALQLHAAAVLTDSGGVQRESAWLGTPCLVLRDSTEWVEAVAGSGDRMVLVGRDRARAAAELARVAPPATAEDEARARAASLRLEPAGAAEAIVAALADAEPAPAGGSAR
ncbi:MAG TPA: UDP-N-acetylglucosamine 2-epimerase, partial [Verrucomicrobiae bacterium]|nr:UDP-N-acetylglucosamine 2-epimerase [Verrucomicrobiae bacterium]